MKKRLGFISLLIVGFLLLVYVVASIISIETVDAGSVKVWSYEKTDKQIKLTVGIGISSHILVYSHYQGGDDNIYITVKRAPIWSLFSFFKHAELDIVLPINSETNYQLFFTDGKNQKEITPTQ